MKKIQRIVVLSLLLLLVLLLSACDTISSVFGHETVTISGEGAADWQNEYSRDGWYAVSAEGLHSVSIDWLAGEVEIAPSTDADVCFAEQAREPISAEDALRYGVKEGTLYIQYCASGRRDLPTKKLTISLPAALANALKAFSVKTISAQTTMKALTVHELTFSGSSGGLTATGMRAADVQVHAISGALCYEGAYQQLDASTSSGAIAVQAASESMNEATETGIVTFDTVSGGVTFDGTYRRLFASSSSGAIAVASRSEAESTKISSVSGDVKLDGAIGNAEVGTSSGSISAVTEGSCWQSQSVSGAVSLTFTTCPAKVEVSTSSGGVALTLPAACGFTLHHSTSGNFKCDFPVVMGDSNYVCGDGAAQITVSSTSGDCRINSAE